VDKFKFEDGDITARQLAKRVTAYREPALQTALENGCQSVPAVMDFLTRRDMERAARHLAGSRLGKVRGNVTYKRMGMSND
jgi:hypothetical protein